MKREITKDDTITLKVIRWYNFKTDTFQYGVDIKVNGKWAHLCEDNKACIYDTKKEAAAKIKEIYFNNN